MRTMPATKKMMDTGMKSKPKESNSFSVNAWATSGTAAADNPAAAADAGATPSSTAPRRELDAGDGTKQHALKVSTKAAAINT
eukprot:CAMPEP_0178399894 /NCGR_PEP_ID=MMETSP0689_2-20121128/15511_1 /TAXON_ID=160604 /ORGANISM="Amphidinium massartii, Strain CS-259" /LENGTH=82 /DNA_ID=CAMNT_0020020677 /DNA_START=103 /DNA_END=351 /DNA_ORIENTATION=+